MGKRKRPIEVAAPDLCPVDFNAVVKNFDDRLLTTPFDNLEMETDVVECLKETFNIHHATPAQVCTISTFSKEHTSIVLQSHTGTGKTLSFLLPLAERMLRFNRSFMDFHQRPYRSIDVHAMIISPHKELSNQTFFTCRKLFHRLSFDVKVVSDIDCFLAEHKRIYSEKSMLLKASRFCGGGVILVATPFQLQSIMQYVCTDDSPPVFCSSVSTTAASPVKNTPTVFIADEIDLLLAKRPQLREDFGTLAKALMVQRSFTTDCSPIDYGFFGATATCSSAVTQWVEELTKSSSCVHFQLVSRGEEEAVEGEFPAQDKGVDAVHDFLVKSLRTMTCTCADQRIVPDSPEKWYIFQSLDREMASGNLKNVYVRAPKDSPIHHMSHLLHVLNVHPTKKHLVFCNAFGTARTVYDHLLALSEQRLLGGDASGILLFHENLSPAQRRKSYLSFIQRADCDAQRSILICTDHLAYGIDIRDIAYVIHFDPPASTEAYLHRMGRTGRMGTKGTSIMLIDEDVDAEAFERLNESLVLTEWKLHNVTTIYL
ncbi:ATP-dependent RNA helicase [Perkinsela sp. CCAP 1560/4]|nr:ATP-dependent RNA helicase [Perkinsela sp. CCAP 1560/4]|eukprot:KNH05757.1 ATP-dependent RNA helicase [Perkinsela sp. CCAP 1560/4]